MLHNKSQRHLLIDFAGVVLSRLKASCQSCQDCTKRGVTCANTLGTEHFCSNAGHSAHHCEQIRGEMLLLCTLEKRQLDELTQIQPGSVT